MSEAVAKQEKGNTPAARGSSTSKMNGAKKAALWLLSTPEDLARETMALLKDDELTLIANEVGSVEYIDPDVVTAIHREFYKRLGRQKHFVFGKMDYFSAVAERALGPKKAARILAPQEAKSVRTRMKLGQLRPSIMTAILEREHPQVIAAVLTRTDASQAAQCLMSLPEDVRKEVIFRTLRLSHVSADIWKRAEQILESSIPDSQAVVSEEDQIDGAKALAALLNRLPEEDSGAIIDTVGEKDEELADEIRRSMFMFEDLCALDRKGMQTLLKEVPSDRLVVALKAASEDLRDLVFSSLSSRASDILKEELETLGPVRLSDVEGAQSEITESALRMKNAGTLTIATGGEDFV